MTKQHVFRMIVLLLSGGFLTGCVAQQTMPTEQTAQVAEQQSASTDNPLIGQIVGVSEKAQTIALEVDGKVILLKNDDTLEGIDLAQKGEEVLILHEIRGNDRYATFIKKKLDYLPEGIKEIPPKELAALIALGPEKGNYSLYDARPFSRYQEGHIDTAVSLIIPTLEEKGAAALPVNKNTHLIFYCGGLTCGLGSSAAVKAKDLGYSNVSVMLEGAPGWKSAGFPLYATFDYIKTGNVILVDLRSENEATAEHIPGAVHIPFPDFEDADSEFPVNRTAPIVLYGNGNEPIEAMKFLSTWAYKNVSLLTGGIKGWKLAGNKIESGKPQNKITWVRKIGPGEISIEEFDEIVAKAPPDIVILDVRTNEESANMKFPNSIHISLDELEARINELPRDKEILIHCGSGVRAEMGYMALKKAGLTARFVVGKFNCDKGGCKISD